MTWLNEKSRSFLSKGYVAEGQTAEERIRAICETAEGYLGIKGYADKLEHYILKGWVSLSSPVWANYGLKRGLPASCNSSLISDTIESILSKVAEIASMTKYGAGTSAYFGNLRPRGAKISTGGESSGPVHFMELFDKITSVISQSSVRRGSMAAYLPVDHPDIHEFLKIRSIGNPIQDLSIGVCISDEWMRGLLNKDKDKLKIWGEIIKKRFETGYPYIVFTDTANNNAPEIYKKKNKKIYSSNLCVAPETLLLTSEGELPISSLEGQECEVWNGEQWSSVIVEKTGNNRKLLSLLFSTDGQIITCYKKLRCTEYHIFYVGENEEQKSAEDLNVGDKIFFQDDCGFNRTYELHSIDDGGYDDTYCVNEPIRHRAVFNGILTGNCNEIMLSLEEDESYVCVLSSVNLLHYDEWKDTDLVETLTYFLDTVTTEYVDKTESIPFLKAAHNFSKTQRAIGLGVLGWHSFLQSKNIAFESMEAKYLNVEFVKLLNEKTLKASKELAKIYGEPELMVGTGERMATRMAFAPTVSSSQILGQVSQGIEPQNSNYFVRKLAKGNYTYKNPYLKVVLKKYEKDTSEVWKSILEQGGSVQHLSFLSDHEKDVFKTFGEISQKEVVIQACQRQKHLDQGQSLNLMIHPKTPPKEVSQLLIFGWENGIKGFYYQKSYNPSQELTRSILECKSCEG